ncbi:MAG: hypothetical protein AMS22_05130 [Thiotrichales bacterium SG8_50]|nr:MAG: hypothetical protein AMS22_05130 [Thiotrichales bacterium SG8_50]
MGVFSDWFANQVVIGEYPYIGQRRVAYQEMQWHLRRTDPEHNAAYLPMDEKQTYLGYVPPGQSAVLQFTRVSDGLTFATQYLPEWFPLNGIQLIVDQEFTANVAGYTDGDVLLSGGTFKTPPIYFEYTGDSVKRQNWSLYVYNYDTGASLPVETTQNGQDKIRYTWSVMYELGLYGPPPPGLGDDLPEDATLLYRPDETIRWPTASLRNLLAQQCAIDDNNPHLECQLQDLFNVKARSSACHRYKDESF